jgi:hypothetical protein
VRRGRCDGGSRRTRRTCVTDPQADRGAGLRRVGHDLRPRSETRRPGGRLPRGHRAALWGSADLHGFDTPVGRRIFRAVLAVHCVAPRRVRRIAVPSAVPPRHPDRRGRRDRPGRGGRRGGGARFRSSAAVPRVEPGRLPGPSRGAVGARGRHEPARGTRVARARVRSDRRHARAVHTHSRRRRRHRSLVDRPDRRRCRCAGVAG